MKVVSDVFVGISCMDVIRADWLFVIFVISSAMTLTLKDLTHYIGPHCKNSPVIGPH